MKSFFYILYKKIKGISYRENAYLKRWGEIQ